MDFEFAYRTKAQGYSSNTALYTVLATPSTTGARDGLVTFASTPMRYAQIGFVYDVKGFELGMFWLGVLTDLGIFWSADGGASMAPKLMASGS